MKEKSNVWYAKRIVELTSNLKLSSVNCNSYLKLKKRGKLIKELKELMRETGINLERAFIILKSNPRKYLRLTDGWAEETFKRWTRKRELR